MKSPKVILFFSLLLMGIIPLFSQTNGKSDVKMKKVSITVNDSVVVVEIPEGVNLIDRSKNLFFLDGKRIKDFEEFDRTDKTPVTGIFSRNALLHFGEMARNGIVFFESNNKEDQFLLQGAIEERFNGNQIMLFTFAKDSIISVDTTIVKNGTFTFSGKEYLNEDAIITTGNYPDEVKSTTVILERGNIHLSLRDDSISVPAYGTPLNDSLTVYENAMEQFNQLGRKLETDLNNDLITSQKYSFLRDSLVKEKYISRSDYIKRNISNLAGKVIIKKIVPNNILVFPNFDEIYAMMSDDLKSDPVIIGAMKFRDEYRVNRDGQNQLLGEPYIDFEFETPDGEKKKLSDYVGKSDYLLIDFWASWCAPCIEEIPSLKKIYDKYNRQQLNIINISLDNDKKAWQKVMKKVNAPWIHLCDFKGSPSELTEKYFIKGIPYLLLIDKNGIIQKVSLREQDLEHTIKSLLQINLPEKK